MRLMATLSLILCSLAFTACGTVGHSRAGIENFDQVSPTLYRGAQPTAQGIETLRAANIKTVINLRDSDDALEAQQVRAAGMAYFHVPLNAETITSADADKVLKIINTAPQPVFVHCLVGRDRTGLAVAAYRVEVQGWTQQAAIKDLIDHGHYWLFFPKVRAAITTIAQRPPSDKSLAATNAPSPNTR